MFTPTQTGRTGHLFWLKCQLNCSDSDPKFGICVYVIMIVLKWILENLSVSSSQIFDVNDYCEKIPVTKLDFI